MTFRGKHGFRIAFSALTTEEASPVTMATIKASWAWFAISQRTNLKFHVWSTIFWLKVSPEVWFCFDLTSAVAPVGTGDTLLVH